MNMKADKIQRIAVVGAGLMGHAIAQEFALAGYEVHLNDVSDDRLKRALRNVAASLKRLAELGLTSPGQIKPVFSRIRASTVLEDTVEDSDVVIETVSEQLALKRRIFRALDRCCPRRTILACNTSTFMPSQLASVTERRDKVLVAHYFNPPYLLPLVELVPSKDTSAQTMTAMRDLLMAIGKKPVLLQKEAPGFVGNRLQAALLREALSIVRKGIAAPGEVDAIVKQGFGRRLAFAGPFEICYLGGLDVWTSVALGLFPQLERSPRFLRRVLENAIRSEFGPGRRRGPSSRAGNAATELRRRITRGLAQFARASTSPVEEPKLFHD